MRVAFAIHQIGSQADGGLRSITEIVRNIPEIDKYIVTNLASDIGKIWSDHADLAIWPMTEASYTSSSSKAFYRLKQIYRRLANNLRMFLLVRRLHIDVVHANDHRAFWNVALGARLAGAKIIFNVRDTLRSEGKTIPLWRACLAICDRFLVLSEEMVAHFREALRPTSDHPRNAAKFSFIYSIVDKAIYYPVSRAERIELRKKLAIAEGRPALAYVARFDDKKAQLDFIRSALPRIAQEDSSVVTYFVGDFDPAGNSYAAACEAEVGRLGLADNVRFVGYSGRVADWYRAADIVVLASKREGLARCIIEGISCGAPVVSFAVSSAHEILTRHECGIVVEAGDYQRLAGEILSLLKGGERMELYRERGTRTALELFDAGRNAGRYKEFLQELLR
jgi:glycosyltransferase involved in cell wall biosynthesis